MVDKTPRIKAYGEGERKKIKIFWNILQHTKADRLLFSYFIFVFITAALIWVFDPTIKSLGNAMWYCYAVISTAGFGDVTVTTPIARILSVLLTFYSLVVLAIVTGVVVNYYNQTLEIRNKDTIAAFLDRLEDLPDLSKEELAEMSDQVRQFRKNWG